MNTEKTLELDDIVELSNTEIEARNGGCGLCLVGFGIAIAGMIIAKLTTK